MNNYKYTHFLARERGYNYNKDYKFYKSVSRFANCDSLMKYIKNTFIVIFFIYIQCIEMYLLNIIKHHICI